jgi:hypothetical protein
MNYNQTRSRLPRNNNTNNGQESQKTSSSTQTEYIETQRKVRNIRLLLTVLMLKHRPTGPATPRERKGNKEWGASPKTTVVSCSCSYDSRGPPRSNAWMNGRPKNIGTSKAQRTAGRPHLVGRSVPLSDSPTTFISNSKLRKPKPLLVLTS